MVNVARKGSQNFLKNDSMAEGEEEVRKGIGEENLRELDGQDRGRTKMENKESEILIVYNFSVFCSCLLLFLTCSSNYSGSLSFLTVLWILKPGMGGVYKIILSL